MKHRKRASSSKPPSVDASSSPAETVDAAGSAFDVWLERGLHKLFDDVAGEPIPPELLQLIEGDRLKAEADEPTSDDNTV